MAKLEPGFFFTGSLGNISAYNMKGTDKIILRTKGGPTGKQIKNAPQFETTRNNGTEFGGRSTAARLLTLALGEVSLLKDHNLVNTLQPLLKQIQLLDEENVKGQRAVCPHLAPQLLQGYSLNKAAQFETVVRSPLYARIDRENLGATVELPALAPKINFFPHRNFSCFRLVVALGIMPGIYYSPQGYGAPQGHDDLPATQQETDWYMTAKGCASTTITLQLPALPEPLTPAALVLSAGIYFGSIREGGVIEREPFSGLGKIIQAR